MADMSVELCGVRLKNPIVAASGTFGFGREYSEFYDLSRLGGICVKGLTSAERPGNPPPRIAETPSGILNSVGLQNPGIDYFCKFELPFLRQYDTVIIANISGNTVPGYGEMGARAADGGVDIIEVNVSCPNLRAGGLAFGTDPKVTATIVEAVKKRSGKTPVIVKLTPNVTDIASIAKAAQEAGADGVSLINTLLGMRIDTETRRPVLANNTGGLSGPAVLPVAVRAVWQVKNAVSIPVMGMGGVSSGRDAAELMLAGASAVGVGTATLKDPMAPVRIIDELTAYAEAHELESVSQLTGAVKPY